MEKFELRKIDEFLFVNKT